MIKKLIIIVFCLSMVPAVQAWDNFTLNPGFEIDSNGNINLTERIFVGDGENPGVFGWTAWCNAENETMVAPLDDRPPARMMAIVGPWEQCSIWQNDWADYYLEADTEYIFEVDLKNIDGCEQVMIVIEDETYSYEINAVFDITDEWDTYRILMDTTAYVDFVGKRVGVAVRVFDADGGRCAATNLRFHVNWNDWAWDPYPVSGAIKVPVDVTLEWNTGERDPNGLVNTDIRKHYLYMSSGSSTDPNLVYAGEIDADPLNPRALYGPLSLSADSIYYWMVEEGLDDGAGGVYPADSPENIAGQTWVFETIKSYPDIIQQPGNVLIRPGETAEFTVVVTSPTAELYQWYRTEDNANNTPADDGEVGGDSNVFQIPNAQEANQAFYYCVITNDVTIPNGTMDPIYSDVAKLGIKMLLAHYTLDSGDYSGGLYLDETNNYNAVVRGEPVFVEGIDGTVDGAVAIDPNSGWANAGTWDPSQWSDQVGISVWVKWDGTLFEGDGPALVAKRDIEYPFRWSLYSRVGDSSHPGSNWLRLTSWYGGDVWVGPDALPANEWAHVAATVDESGAHIYINGVEAGSGSWTFGPETDDPIYIGRGSTADWSYPGALDDVRIYSHGLSRFEVADLYNAVTGENVCTGDYASEWDMNDDCKVNIDDFAAVAAEWLKCGWYPSCL